MGIELVSLGSGGSLFVGMSGYLVILRYGIGRKILGSIDRVGVVVMGIVGVGCSRDLGIIGLDGIVRSIRVRNLRRYVVGGNIIG